MNSDDAVHGNDIHPRSTVPRWLNVLSLCFMALLLTVILIFIVGFATAGPEQNLAGVLVILAGVLALPFVAAASLWGIGSALKVRFPAAALVLIVASTFVGGLGVALLASWFLLGL